MNGRALSLTANTEGEKDGRAGRNAILQRSLFKSTLSIQYIFYITWLTSLQFSDSSRLKFCSLIDNLLIPNFLKISKFKILSQHFMLFHPWIFPLASSKLCHRGWKRKKEREGVESYREWKRDDQRNTLYEISTRSRNRGTWRINVVCFILAHTFYMKRYRVLSLPGLEGRIRRFTNSFQFLISGSRLNFFGRWMDEEIRGMIINFEQGGNIGCNDILIIFKKTRTTLIRSVNYFQLLLWIIGE